MSKRRSESTHITESMLKSMVQVNDAAPPPIGLRGRSRTTKYEFVWDMVSDLVVVNANDFNAGWKAFDIEVANLTPSQVSNVLDKLRNSARHYAIKQRGDAVLESVKSNGENVPHGFARLFIRLVER